MGLFLQLHGILSFKTMKVLFKLFVILISTIALTGCEEIIELPLKEAEPRLVIEGKVNDLFTRQEVLISEMQPFGSVSGRKPVTNAEVYLNEDDKPWRKLREVESGKYIIDNFLGKPGSTYGISVKYSGETYQAQSTMPPLVRIDSIGIRINSFDNSRKTPIVSYQDIPGVKNYYYFRLVVNGEVNTSLFIFNDKYTDGKNTIQNLDDFSLDLQDDDDVIVELRNIDESSFNYWKGIQSQNGSSASPGNPVSNFSNGALGYFSAYSVSSMYFTVQ